VRKLRIGVLDIVSRGPTRAWLLTAFGQAAPLNLDYQRVNRVLPFPFYFLNNNQAMNVRPKHYAWPTFDDHVIDVVGYSFSWRAILRRFRATAGVVPRMMNVLRAVSTEGFGRLRYYREIRRRLDADRQFRPYFEQETTELPRFYLDLVRKDLGRLWDWLPEGALFHDPYAYLKCQAGRDASETRFLRETGFLSVPADAANGAATADGKPQALTPAPGVS
jgi:hypothetical protein